MKVIIAGSRDIIDLDEVRRALDNCGFEVTEVVSGGATGVDSLGETLARLRNIPIKQFIPAWDGYAGKRAGFVRNAQMALYADALVAVWDGKSRGTKHMIDRMRENGKPVFIYTPRSVVVDLRRAMMPDPLD